MKFASGAILLLLLCSCQAKRLCNAEVAQQIATAHAKSKLGARYKSDEKVIVGTEGQNLKFSFFDERFLGGGLEVWVDKTSCEITDSLFGQ